MQNRRKSDKDRRIAERRNNNEDVRHDTEKGMTGDRRSGSDRRGRKERRQTGEVQQTWL